MEILVELKFAYYVKVKPPSVYRRSRDFLGAVKYLFIQDMYVKNALTF